MIVTVEDSRAIPDTTNPDWVEKGAAATTREDAEASALATVEANPQWTWEVEPHVFPSNEMWGWLGAVRRD